MIKITFLFLLSIIIFNDLKSQKLFIFPYLKGQMIGLTNVSEKRITKTEFNKNYLNLVAGYGIDFKWKRKNCDHVFNIEHAALGQAYEINNKYKFLPPFEPTVISYKNNSSINYYLFSYLQERNIKNEVGFVFKSKIKFCYAFGVGLAINANKAYYEIPEHNYYIGGFAIEDSYIEAERFTKRVGNGILAQSRIGFNILNSKTKKTVIAIDAYFNQGLLTMNKVTVNYRYGFYRDPLRQVDVRNTMLNLRGTSFGFRLGIPITL